MTHGPRLILAIVLMAAATALTRFLPFLVFGRGRKPPKAIEYLGRALPPAHHPAAAAPAQHRVGRTGRRIARRP